MQLYLTHWLKYGLRKLIVCFRAELIALDEIFIIWCSHLGKSHMCGSSAHRIHMSTTQPKSHQKLQDVTHNYVPTPFYFCNPRNASERQRGSTGADWKLDSCYKQRQYCTAKWTEQSICSFWNILKFTSATLSRPLSRPLSRVHRPEAVKTFLNVTSGNLQCMASTFTHTHIQPASSTGQSPHVLQDSNRVTGSMMAVCCKISQCRSKCGQSVLAIMDCHVLIVG